MFYDKNNFDFFPWDIKLNNNNINFVQGIYTNPSNISSNLWEYYGDVVFYDQSIHSMIENTTGTIIEKGSKLKFTDYSKRYVTIVNSDDYDAVAITPIEVDSYGIVQTGGDLVQLLDYMNNHATL